MACKGRAITLAEFLIEQMSGLARVFRDRYPEMFREYQDLCRAGRLSIGALHVWRGPDRRVLNLPTKTS